MSNEKLTATVAELRELRRMSEELAAEIEALTDEIKAYMDAQSVDTLAGVDYKITWKEVKSRRFDSAALKSAEPEIYSRFAKETTARRFVLT